MSIEERQSVVDSQYQKLSIIIPVYNEESTIGRVLEEIGRVDLGDMAKEVIVVDDGSTDQTSQIVRRHAEATGEIAQVYASPVNFGKGAAIRIGLKYVTGGLVLIQDADLELDPQEYRQLLEPILAGEAKVVYGSRFLRKVPGLRLRSRVANWVLARLANLLYRTRLTDEATAYKVFDAGVIKSLNLKCIGFEFCPEVTAKVALAGYTIREVPISYHPRGPEEGKKVRWTDGLVAVWTLIKYRFSR